MKYLENAIKFITRHYILAVPLLISTAIAALLGGSTTGFTGRLWEILAEMKPQISSLRNPSAIMSLVTTAAVISGAGFISLVLTLIVTPATYGMVNKALNEGFATLNDFVPQFKNNIAKYLIFWLGNLVIWIVFSIICVLLIVITSLISAIIKWLGLLLFIIVFITMFIAAVYISVNITLWFPAMAIDNLDVVSAFKKSFSLVKKHFWMILGICVLVTILSSLANLILSIPGMIPLLGPILLSVVPSASTFIMIVFYLMYYKDETMNLV